MNSLYRRYLIPTLLVFLLWLIVDSYIALAHPQLISLRATSKIIMMTIESFLIFLSLKNKSYTVAFVWFANLWIASTILMSLAVPPLTLLTGVLLGLAIPMVIAAGLIIFVDL